MRDPERIEPMLALLREVWLQSPDWRLGQLIALVTPHRFNHDPFYVEDDEMRAGLENFRRGW